MSDIMITIPAVTITVPDIDLEVISNLETTASLAERIEAQALRMLREKYAPLAKHGGFVKLASYSDSAVNNGKTCLAHLAREGRKVRAFIALDLFEAGRETKTSGSLSGVRLYLTEHNEWMELERRGKWSRSIDCWTCGEWWEGRVGTAPTDEQVAILRDIGIRASAAPGHHRVLTDEEVAGMYDLQDILTALANSIKKCRTKILYRMAKVNQRLQLADQVFDALVRIQVAEIEPIQIG
jgi:hypothetical protein